MKALANPLLLLVCIVLLACDAAAASESLSVRLEGWVLALCFMGFLINGALGLARALSQRSPHACMGWALVFLLFGGVAWLLVSQEAEGSISSQERVTLRQRVKAWRAGGDPYALDSNGDNIPLLAAGLGREKLLEQLLKEEPDALQQRAPLYAAALHRAAERNREGVLRQLVGAGVAVDARVEGLTPLHAAALRKARRSAASLLELGAPVNAPGVDGLTPLHQAVLAEDVPMVRLLLQHGADPALEDTEGRVAADYARTEELEEALTAPLARP